MSDAYYRIHFENATKAKDSVENQFMETLDMNGIKGPMQVTLLFLCAGSGESEAALVRRMAEEPRFRACRLSVILLDTLAYQRDDAWRHVTKTATQLQSVGPHIEVHVEQDLDVALTTIVDRNRSNGHKNVLCALFAHFTFCGASCHKDARHYFDALQRRVVDNTFCPYGLFFGGFSRDAESLGMYEGRFIAAFDGHPALRRASCRSSNVHLERLMARLRPVVQETRASDQLRTAHGLRK